MEYKIYENLSVLIEKKDSLLYLNIVDSTKSFFEQKKLFTQILNFGYTPFSEGTFKITDRQIIDFWNCASSSVLKNTELKDYYAVLNLPPIYEAQIPTLKISENFNSPSNKLSVVWINDTDAGKMASSPKAYRRDGLELFNFEDEKLGSLYPEYFELYEIIDETNLYWESWTKTDRYTTLEKIAELGKNRKIVLPQELEQTLEYLKSD